MTPANFTTPFYNGAAWSFTFRLKKSDGTAFDLTGREPFVMSIRKVDRTTNILEINAVSDYDETGILTFSLTEAQTRRLPLGRVLVGIRDGSDLPFAVGEVTVHPFP